MATTSFGPQIPFTSAAAAVGLTAKALDRWDERFPLFRGRSEPKRLPRLLTAPEVLALRVAVIAVRRHNFPVGDALSWCHKHAVPAFAALLTGERQGGTIEMMHEKTGAVMCVDLASVAAGVLKKLGLATVRHHVERSRPTEAQLLAEVERVQRYLQSPEYRERLAAFRKEVKERGTPTTWPEACTALGVPFWIFQLAIASPPIVEAVALPLGLPPPSKADLQEEERQ
jgi:hypothetical protein